MGGRFIVSGVQMGILRANLSLVAEPKVRKIFYDLIEEIFDKQFAGSSERVVEDDAIVLLEKMVFEEK